MNDMTARIMFHDIKSAKSCLLANTEYVDIDSVVNVALEEPGFLAAFLFLNVAASLESSREEPKMARPARRYSAEWVQQQNGRSSSPVIHSPNCKTHAADVNIFYAHALFLLKYERLAKIVAENVFFQFSINCGRTVLLRFEINLTLNSQNNKQSRGSGVRVLDLSTKYLINSWWNFTSIIFQRTG